MTFEEFYAQNPQYSFLVAKIQYNIEQEKKAKNKSLADLVINFTVDTNDICESCSA